MTSFGRYLLQERELRAMSREEVARVTRLPLGAILAIEEDRFDALPAEVFAVGYIRNYASAIGLDPNDAVLRYQEARQADRPGPRAGEPAATPAEGDRPRAIPLWAIAGLAGFALGFAATWRLWRP